VKATQVRRRVALAGRVVEGATGEAVAGAAVELTAVPEELRRRLAVRSAAFGAAWEARRSDLVLSDAYGRFAFLDLPEGSYEVTASLPAAGSRYGTFRSSAEVARGKQSAPGAGWLKLTLPATTIAGTVTGADRTPVPLAWVEVVGSGLRTLTDAKGRYVLAGLHGARSQSERRGRHCTLRVRALGHAAEEKVIDLPCAGTPHTVDVALSPASRGDNVVEQEG
jgi:hypothetical protein